jgi:hypothetical protein
MEPQDIMRWLTVAGKRGFELGEDDGLYISRYT